MLGISYYIVVGPKNLLCAKFVNMEFWYQYFPKKYLIN